MAATTRRQVRERANDRCEYCRLPQAAAPFLTFHIEHIQASQHVRDDRLDNRIEGRTTTGTATARLLKMNADDQVEIRAALMLRGEF